VNEYLICIARLCSERYAHMIKIKAHTFVVNSDKSLEFIGLDSDGEATEVAIFKEWCYVVQVSTIIPLEESHKYEQFG
jgi:hypothetical protein